MRILLATDGSKHSETAVEMVKNFIFPLLSEIKIVSVIDTVLPFTMDIYGSGYILPVKELENVARQNALTVLENTKQKILEKFSAESVTVSTEVLIGSPESQIVEIAEKMHADLIIVGSHGYNSWERLLLGSVSDSVVHHAPCSVLVVRTAKNKL
jgi:nucleotide-binding universal stress UspA family protein